VAAVVVPRVGSTVSIEELSNDLVGLVGRFQIPTTWWFREGPLPVNTTGKVLKRELKQDWPGHPASKAG
jgi:acyl-CoA synthetase (AMP-forming)/AMP-acid ligase II